MSRGLGVGPDLATALEPVEPLLALATQLGDVWFLLALAVGLYWFGDRIGLAGWSARGGLVVLSAALLAFSVTYLAKWTIALPRPPGAGTAAYAFEGVLGAVYADAATGSGYGFPSGHALGSAAVYGAIGLYGRGKGATRLRSVALGAVVALVCLTRLGLGVHYLVDVAVGVAVGLAVAAVAVRLAARPATVVGIAALAALVSPITGGFDVQSALLVGGTVGSLGAIYLVDPLGRAAPRSGQTVSVRAVALATAGCLLAALALLAASAVVPSAGFASLGAGLLVVTVPVARSGGEK